jgi:AcrR family transcriptional regulator
VRAFGAHPYDEVTVGDLSADAGVTTGAIYHHFESKLGLYQFVRVDVERRLLDRMEGAASATTDRADAITSAMLVGFDFAVEQDFFRILGDPPARSNGDDLADLLARLSAPAPAPLGSILAAAWRASLLSVAEGASVEDARSALSLLRVS